MKRAILWAAAAVALIAFTAVSVAPAAGAEVSSNPADFAFMKKADQINTAEIKLGKLAEQRAVSSAVTKFGERMVSDHSQLNEELDAIAAKEEVKLPKQLDRDHEQLYDELSKLNGVAFDHTYAKDMVAGHKKAIALFETEAKNGSNPDVKSWAEKSLPTLREHLELAKSAVKAVKDER